MKHHFIFSLSSLLIKGVFVIAGLNLQAASATTLTEAAALLNLKSSGEVTGLVRDAEKLLRNYDKKGSESRKQQSVGVDENVIPFLSNLVESIAQGKTNTEKVTQEKVVDTKIVVKSEPVVIRRIAKVEKLPVVKLPVVKQWAGLHRTMPTPNWNITLLKKDAVAKPQ